MPSGGPTVAKAFVAIIPTTQGAQKAIADGFLPAAEKAGLGAGATSGEALTESMAATIKKGAVKVAGAIAAIGVGKAFVDLTRGAIDAYSSMEQLTGGIETIFGEDTGRRVEEMASTAFRRVQMSANDYMEAVTGFSASLIQSMGGDTEAAADMADVALTDMADNANKMGSSMASIQNAYQGFAKQNYSMLDNLKLGYGGTQEEMYRLLQDAASLNEEFAATADFSIDEKGHLSAGFDDIIRAIHIIQDDLGIAGASAMEAAETLEGSTNMMKAAWGDWLATIATGDMSAIQRTTQNLAESVVAWLGNLLPRIATTLGSLVQLVPQAIKGIISSFPAWASQIWASLVDALANSDIDIASAISPEFREALSIISEIIPWVEALLDRLADRAQAIFASIVALFARVGDAFKQVFGEISLADIASGIYLVLEKIINRAAGAIRIIAGVVTGFLDSISTEDIAAFLAVVKDVADAVLPRAQAALALVGRIIGEVIWPALQALGEFFVSTILPALQDLWIASQPILSAIVEYVGVIFDSAISLANALIDVLGPAISIIWEVAQPIAENIIAAIVDIWSLVSDFYAENIREASATIGEIAQGISDFLSAAGRWIAEHRDKIIAVIKVIQMMMTSASDTASGVVQSILGAFGWMRDTLAWIWSQVTGAVDAALWSAWNIVSGFVGGIVDAFWGLVNSIGAAFSTLASAITAPFASAFRAIRTLWNSTIGGFGFDIPSWIPGVGGASFEIPYLAAGGDVITGGSVIVGEAGPELLTLPRGARVAPLSDANATGAVTYQVMVGDVDLTSDEQVKRVTRDYLEFLVSVARPVAVGSAF